jgi:hypothetical protein
MLPGLCRVRLRVVMMAMARRVVIVVVDGGVMGRRRGRGSVEGWVGEGEEDWMRRGIVDKRGRR